MMDFSFLDESESNILKLTKDCKEFPSLAYVAAARSQDPAKYNLSLLYSFKLDGVDMLVASDGHRINYTPFVSGTDFVVVKQTKNELVFERTSSTHKQMPGFDKVIPHEKDMFQIKPYDIYDYGTSDWKFEFLVDYLYRLANFEVYFNFKHLTDFADNLRSDGKIRILCPRRSPNNAWRIEHTDTWGNLRHGTVFMPLPKFDELVDVKSPYIEGAGFEDYSENHEDFNG
jgi:hypothetical protein